MQLKGRFRRLLSRGSSPLSSTTEVPDVARAALLVDFFRRPHDRCGAAVASAHLRYPARPARSGVNTTLEWYTRNCTKSTGKSAMSSTHITLAPAA
jgi:hypothetical protein